MWQLQLHVSLQEVATDPSIYWLLVVLGNVYIQQLPLLFAWVDNSHSVATLQRKLFILQTACLRFELSTLAGQYRKSQITVTS